MLRVLGRLLLLRGRVVIARVLLRHVSAGFLARLGRLLELALLYLHGPMLLNAAGCRSAGIVVIVEVLMPLILWGGIIRRRGRVIWRRRVSAIVLPGLLVLLRLLLLLWWLLWDRRVLVVMVIGL